MRPAHQPVVAPYAQLERATVNVIELAAVLLGRTGPLDVSGLHRLVYYAQVTTLVATRRSLFDERIEAWSLGPVAPSLFRMHEGKWRLHAADLPTPRALDDMPNLLDHVVSSYGSPRWQSVEDKPWHDARRGLDVTHARGPEITEVAILAYYSR
jgi:uncharacterized phage-associated protein